MYTKWKKFTINSKLHFYYASFQEVKSEFYIPTNLKASKPGRYQTTLIFTKCLKNKKTCVIAFIDKYKKWTLLLRSHLSRNENTFMLSHTPPYISVSSAKIARYIKIMLELAQIDVTVLTCHSTRRTSD